MSHHTFGARPFVRSLTGLDFGLRIHVKARPCQRTIFFGAENLPVQALTSELSSRVLHYECEIRREEDAARRPARSGLGRFEIVRVWRAVL
jgi:hypothetical protein